MQQNELNMRSLALAVLQGKLPQRLPFITRLETWYLAHKRRGTLPARFRDMTLDQVHQHVGVGRLKFSNTFGFRLVGVDVRMTFNGEDLSYLSEPEVENFPGMWDKVPTDRAGITQTELITPIGKLTLKHRLLEEGVLNATDPYLQEHLIKSEADLGIAEYILEHIQLVPLFEKLRREWDEIGENGLLVPLLPRIPFQQILLEYLGEESVFYGLHDNPGLVRRLLLLLDQQILSALEKLAALDMPYVEFPDNLHGLMTNPKLFQKYCLPAYRKYVEVLHQQGKKAGSHVDGDVKPLLGLLVESNLDVCESVSPAPLTACTFREINAAWRGRPIIWGAIPTPILEEGTREEDFRAYLADLLTSIDQPVILGLVDLFMPLNSIKRVEYVAKKVERMDLSKHLHTVGAKPI